LNALCCLPGYRFGCCLLSRQIGDEVIETRALSVYFHNKLSRKMTAIDNKIKIKIAQDIFLITIIVLSPLFIKKMTKIEGASKTKIRRPIWDDYRITIYAVTNNLSTG